MLPQTRRFSVSMPPSLYTRLLTSAQTYERSLAAHVRFIIREYLYLLAGDHPQQTLVAYDALQRTTDEIFTLRRRVEELSPRK